MAFNTTPIGFAYADMELNGSIMVNVPSVGSGGIGFDAGVDAQTSLQFQGTFPTSSNLTYLVRANGIIPSGTTTTARIFASEPQTAAASFTVTTLQHYLAAQGALGAGSAITTQAGFVANSTLTGATNNYGFQGSIAAGSNRFNCYMSGTADNYFAGSVGVGQVPAADQKFRLSGTYPSSSNVTFVAIADGTIPSTSTTSAITFSSSVGTAAGSYTIGAIQHFRVAQGTFGAGSSVTDQYGFLVQSGMTGATNNYAFFADLASGSGRFNFYAGGDAVNYFAGNVGINTTTPSEKLEVNGSIKTAAPAGGTAAAWRLGTVATVSPTSPNRTIEVEIGGTTYYIHAKTTND